MKIKFPNRLEGIDWIASFVEDEGHFEILREELSYNFIYEGSYFLEIEEASRLAEVVLLKD